LELLGLLISRLRDDGTMGFVDIRRALKWLQPREHINKNRWMRHIVGEIPTWFEVPGITADPIHIFSIIAYTNATKTQTFQVGEIRAISSNSKNKLVSSGKMNDSQIQIVPKRISNEMDNNYTFKVEKSNGACLPWMSSTRFIMELAWDELDHCILIKEDNVKILYEKGYLPFEHCAIDPKPIKIIPPPISQVTEVINKRFTNGYLEYQVEIDGEHKWVSSKDELLYGKQVLVKQFEQKNRIKRQSEKSIKQQSISTNKKSKRKREVRKYMLPQQSILELPNIGSKKGNRLEKANIKTLQDIINLSEYDLNNIKIKHIGSLKKITSTSVKTYRIRRTSFRKTGYENSSILFDFDLDIL